MAIQQVGAPVAVEIRGGDQDHGRVFRQFGKPAGRQRFYAVHQAYARDARYQVTGEDVAAPIAVEIGAAHVEAAIGSGRFAENDSELPGAAIGRIDHQPQPVVIVGAIAKQQVFHAVAVEIRATRGSCRKNCSKNEGNQPRRDGNG
ncbi:MAG: hypothetical protein IPH83_07415 [Gammaproteobacteria bacterium]|nr:hypothetical protein [Gammaproteobacteria bacterium]